MVKKLKQLSIETIDLANVDKNPWNSNVMSPENKHKLMESVKRNGSFKPIIVRRLSDQTYQILGGENRADVAREMGESSIPAIVHENMSEETAKEISISDNARYGSDDSEKLSELIASMNDGKELSEFLPYSDGEIDVFLSNINVDDSALNFLDDDEYQAEDQDTRKNDFAKEHHILRFKIPVDDHDFVSESIASIIKKQGYMDSDSLTNAGDALVFLLSKMMGRKSEE